MAGLATALALAKQGFTHIDVYEYASNLGFVGAGIQLAPNMARILDRLGVWQEVEKEAVDLKFTSIRGICSPEPPSLNPWSDSATRWLLFSPKKILADRGTEDRWRKRRGVRSCRPRLRPLNLHIPTYGRPKPNTYSRTNPAAAAHNKLPQSASRTSTYSSNPNPRDLHRIAPREHHSYPNSPS